MSVNSIIKKTTSFYTEKEEALIAWIKDNIKHPENFTNKEKIYLDSTKYKPSEYADYLKEHGKLHFFVESSILELLDCETDRKLREAADAYQAFYIDKRAARWSKKRYLELAKLAKKAFKTKF